jgi:hypothetical protein
MVITGRQCRIQNVVINIDHTSSEPRANPEGSEGRRYRTIYKIEGFESGEFREA